MKNLLIICTSAKDRSPALAKHFSEVFPDLSFRAAGINKFKTMLYGTHYLTDEDIEWADVFICCEKIHLQKLIAKGVNLSKEFIVLGLGHYEPDRMQEYCKAAEDLLRFGIMIRIGGDIQIDEVNPLHKEIEAKPYVKEDEPGARFFEGIREHDLVELAKKYGTDKLSHGYLPYYAKHLPSVNKFCEVGVCTGAGSRMFRDYYGGKGEFHGIDAFWGKCEVVTKEQFQKEGFICYEGYESDFNFLGTLPKDFDVIVNDASHHSDEMALNFKYMFLNNLKPGGLFVVEDLHTCEEEFWRRGKCEFKDTMLYLLDKFVTRTAPHCDTPHSFESKLISKAESDQLINSIKEVNFYPKEGIAFIFKKG